MEPTANTSQIIRKSWILAPGEDSAPVPMRDRLGRVSEWLALLIRKFCHLSALTAVAAVTLMYIGTWSDRLILGLRDALMGVFLRLSGAPEGDPAATAAAAEWFAAFYQLHLSYYVQSFAPVLELKFYTWTACGLLLIPAYLAGALLHRLTGVEVFPSDQSEPLAGSRRLRRTVLWGGVAFLAFSLLSIRFWLPPMPDGAQLSYESGGGGFFHSTVSWGMTCFGFVYLLVMMELVRTRRFVHKYITLAILLGTLCSIGTILQQLKPAWFTAFWVRFGEDDFRNALGSFIGHNTGLSSYLIAPFFFALGALFILRERAGLALKGALAASLAMMGYALVLAQSRAVVPIVGLGLVLFAVLAMRRARYRIPLRFAGAGALVLAAIIASQIIPNPLARREITLVQRLQDFTAKRILVEARLRLNVISARLVGESPLVGHGFGSFQYVYPEEQRAFYLEHPRSPLAPVGNWSLHTHNEYMQTLVETGAIGLALALAALGAGLRLGWMALRATLDRDRTLWQIVILVALLGYLAHCLVDFPLRIAPLCLTLVMLLAIWTSAERVWLTPLCSDYSGSSREDIPGLDTERSDRAAAASLAARQLLVVATLLAATASLAYVQTRTIGRLYSGRALRAASASALSAAQQLLRSGNSAQRSEADRLMKAAEGQAQAAFYFLPVDGNVRLQNAIARQAIAGRNGAEAAWLLSKGETARGEAKRDLAASDLRWALGTVGQVLSEQRHSFVYQKRFEILRLLAANASTPDERASLMGRAIVELRHAWELNPGQLDSAQDLVETLEPLGTPEADTEIVRVLGSVHHFNPGFVRDVFFADATRLLEIGQYRRAFLAVRRLSAAAPDEPVYAGTATVVAIRADLVDEAREMLRRQRIANVIDPGTARLLEALLAIREGQTVRAASLMADLPEPAPEQAVEFRAYRAVIDLTAGGMPPHEQTQRAVDLIARLGGSQLDLQVTGVALYEVGGAPNLAVLFLERARELNGTRRNPQLHAVLARCHEALGQYDKAFEALDRVWNEMAGFRREQNLVREELLRLDALRETKGRK